GLEGREVLGLAADRSALGAIGRCPRGRGWLPVVHPGRAILLAPARARLGSRLELRAGWGGHDSSFQTTPLRPRPTRRAAAPLPPPALPPPTRTFTVRPSIAPPTSP